MEKEIQYAAMINDKILELFSDEEGDVLINIKDLEDPGNLKAFFHALATMVPTRLFNKLTGGDEDNLSFNHIANHLIFEYSLPPKEGKIIVTDQMPGQ